MTLLLDTSLWIDFTRARSQVHLAEPVRFELLRSARPAA